MSVFELGDPINGSPHSVCVSLPTMRDVIGYEENDPAVRGALRGGYPRFVEPPLRRRWQDLAAQAGGGGAEQWRAVTSLARAQAAAAAAGGEAAGASVREWGGGVFVVSAPGPAADRVKAYLQHTGGSLSTRGAEVLLAAAGALPEGIFAERRAPDAVQAAAKVRAAVAEAAGVTPAEVRLAHSGMNAFFAAWQAVNQLQAGRGRPPRWIRLGWLYVDTMRILERFGPADCAPAAVVNARDLGAVEQLLEAEPEGFAGIVVEVPGNPLAESPDVAALAERCARYGVVCVLDPSVAGIWNVNVLAAADVVVTSLTKYAAAAGDVLAGATVVNPAGRWATELAAGLEAALEPLGAEDTCRLAAQVGAIPDTLGRINRNAGRVARFLGSHPAVDAVWWAEHPAVAPAYAQVRRPDGGSGAIITFTLRGTGGPEFAAAWPVLARFYDEVALAKSPSFGTRFTMLCPYLYLAHFDLVTSTPGRQHLLASGLNPELIRLSVGTEEPGDIIAALAAALPSA